MRACAEDVESSSKGSSLTRTDVVETRSILSFHRNVCCFPREWWKRGGKKFDVSKVSGYQCLMW